MYKVQGTKYEARNTGCLPMSNIQRRVKNVEVVFIQKSKFGLRYFQFRTSPACRRQVFRPRTFYIVLGTWYLVLGTLTINPSEMAVARSKAQK